MTKLVSIRQRNMFSTFSFMVNRKRTYWKH